MSLRENLGELTKHVATVLGDGGRPEEKLPGISDAKRFLLHNRRMLSDRWALGQDGARARRAVLDLCLGDPQVRGTATSRQVGDIIRDHLIEGLDDGSDAASVASKIVDTLLSEPSTCRVFLPLTNLDVVDGPVRIGPVTMLPKDHPTSREYRKKMVDTWHELWDAMLEDRVQPSAFAEVRVEAMSKSETEVGERRLEEVLNYLRCYYAEHAGADAGTFGLPATYSRGMTIGFAFDEDRNPLHPSGRKKGTVPAKLTNERMQSMRERWGLESVSTVLSVPRSERVDAEDDMRARLSHAIHWGGRATQERDPAYRAADYGVALDSLVLRNGLGRVAFGERVALLVEMWCVEHGTTIAQVFRSAGFGTQDDVAEWAKSFYKECRCAVLHGGALRLSPRWEREIERWPAIALMCIAVVANNINQWPTFAQFEAACP